MDRFEFYTRRSIFFLHTELNTQYKPNYIYRATDTKCDVFKHAADRWRINVVYLGSQYFLTFWACCLYWPSIHFTFQRNSFVCTHTSACVCVCVCTWCILQRMLSCMEWGIQSNANDKNSARWQEMHNSGLLGAFVCWLQVECCAALPSLFLRHAGMSYSQ
jgi:hypothetical protein